MLPSVLCVGSAIPRSTPRDGALRVELQLRGAGADQLHAGIGEHTQLVLVALDHADVHQLGELVDIGVALVGQGRVGRVADLPAGQLAR